MSAVGFENRLPIVKPANNRASRIHDRQSERHHGHNQGDGRRAFHGAGNGNRQGCRPYPEGFASLAFGPYKPASQTEPCALRKRTKSDADDDADDNRRVPRRQSEQKVWRHGIPATREAADSTEEADDLEYFFNLLNEVINNMNKLTEKKIEKYEEEYNKL